MAIYQTTLPLVDALKGRNGADRFIVGTLPELLDRCEQMKGAGRTYSERESRTEWGGNLGFQGSIDRARNGDLGRVPKSDALLQRYEALAPATRKMRTIASVAGGCPNVGAYLAGSPMAMRRRERLLDNVGPLAIIVDTTCSAGISNDMLDRRGAAVLALVRLLALSRPVTLHVGCSIATGSNRNNCLHAYAQIDTAPLDVARTAHVLASPAYNRGLLYGLALDAFNDSGYAQWPYDNTPELLKEHAHDILGRVIHGEEFFYVPPAYLTDDKIMKAPEEWLTDMVKKFGANPDSDEMGEAA